MIAMGVVVSVLILGKSGLRLTFLVTPSDHIEFDIPWSLNMHDTSQSSTLFHVHYLHILLLSYYILPRAFIPFWSRAVGKRGTTGKMSTNKWKVWVRFNIVITIMILNMTMIILLIQDNHTGPDILLKKTIQDVLNATFRFWFYLSNKYHTFCIDIERKKQGHKREGFSFTKSIYKCESSFSAMEHWLGSNLTHWTSWRLFGSSTQTSWMRTEKFSYQVCACYSCQSSSSSL